MSHPNPESNSDNRKLRYQNSQVDTSGTSGDSREKDWKDAANVDDLGTPVAPQTPTKNFTGQEDYWPTHNE